MEDHAWLAERFEEHRPHLRAVAHRMLGSTGEADDAVQEAWLRLSRSDAGAVENLGGWLTTVVSRVCLDMLRSRKSRREAPSEPDQIFDRVRDEADTDQEALLAYSVGPAMLVVLEALTPAERVAFVLHDVFGVPFREISPIVGRSPDATKMLASRARGKVRGTETAPEADLGRQREVVQAFLAASREGDFDALLALLDERVVLEADDAAVHSGASREVRGAQQVAGTFSGRARAARFAIVDGAPGAVWAPGGRPRFAFRFEVAHGKIVGIYILADPEQLSRISNQEL